MTPDTPDTAARPASLFGRWRDYSRSALGIDLTGLEVLMQLDRELRAKGLVLHLSELKGPVRDRLDRTAIADWLSGRIFMTQAEAYRALAAGGGGTATGAAYRKTTATLCEALHRTRRP